MNNFDIDINDGYFFTSKNINAIKKNSKATKIVKSFLEAPLKIVNSTIQENLAAKVNLKKTGIPNEPLLHEVVKKIRNVNFKSCERSDLNKFFDLKIKDFFPIMGF